MRSRADARGDLFPAHSSWWLMSLQARIHRRGKGGRATSRSCARDVAPTHRALAAARRGVALGNTGFAARPGPVGEAAAMTGPPQRSANI